jgi:hypothetical protein
MRVPLHEGMWLNLPPSETNEAVAVMRRFVETEVHHPRRLTRDEVLIVADPRPWYATPSNLNGTVTKHHGPGPHRTGTTQREAHGQGISRERRDYSAMQTRLVPNDTEDERYLSAYSDLSEPMTLSGERRIRIRELVEGLNGLATSPEVDWLHKPERLEAIGEYTEMRTELHALLLDLDDDDMAWLRERGLETVGREGRVARIAYAEAHAARLQAKWDDVTFDFTAIHPDLIPTYVEEIDRLLSDYTDDESPISFFGCGLHPRYRFFDMNLEEDRQRAQMGGAWVPDETQWNGVTEVPNRTNADGDDRPRIFLNPFMVSTPMRVESILSQFHGQGWSVIAEPADVLTHEFGHALAHMAPVAPVVHTVTDSVWQATFEEMRSTYGFSNWDEGQAELFTYFTKQTRPLVDAAIAEGRDPKGAIEDWTDQDPIAAMNVAAGEMFWNLQNMYTPPPERVTKHPGSDGSDIHDTGTGQEVHGGGGGAAASYERVKYPRLTQPDLPDETDETHAAHDPWEHHTEKEQLAIQSVMNHLARTFTSSLVAQGASEQDGTLVADRRRTAVLLADLFRQAYEQMEPEQFEHAVRWYHEAHDLAASLADTYDITLPQAVAVIAALSSGSAWETEGESTVADNKSIAEMVIAKFKENPTVAWTRQQAEALKASSYGRGPDTFDLLGDADEVQVKLNDLPVEALLFPHPTNEEDGANLWKEAGGAMAGSTGFMQNLMTSMRALRSDGTIEALDTIIGGPKYRSFFNNILDPDNAHNSTIDIWMLRIFANDRQLDFSGDLEDPEVDAYLESQGKTIADMEDGRKQYKRAVFMEGRGMAGAQGVTRLGHTAGRLGGGETKSAIGSNLGAYWWYDSVVQLAHDLAMGDPNYEGPDMTPSAFQSVLWNWVKFVRDW